MTWFHSLNEGTQIALISAGGVVFSGVISAVIAYLGFKITFKTSTSANERIAAITKENSVLQVRFEAESKIAEMRQKWIDDLRDKLAEFGDETFKAASNPTAEAIMKSRLQYLIGYIALKLNQKEAKHRELILKMQNIIEIINDCVSQKKDTKEAKEKGESLRATLYKIQHISDDILKEEWSRVKSEIRSVTLQ
jgi:hypothetical protein